MPFLRNTWYVAGHAEELTNGPVGRTFLNEEVLIFRSHEGVLAAMSNRCPHRFAPLNMGKVVGNCIQCPYHGMQFDSEGNCVSTPDRGRAPPRSKLKTYPIVERHSLLWIWMGRAEGADATLIPDFSDRDDPSIAWFTGVLHCRANYQLIVDNLLDLTHAEYLHPLLSSSGWAQRNEQTVVHEGDRITINNIAKNDNILPLAKQLKPSLGDIGTTIHTERWNAPSLVRLSVDYYSGEDSLLVPSAHMLTPETESSTHYFVRGGQTLEPSNVALTQANRTAVLAVFQNEDIPLIEAQQRYLGDCDLMEFKPAILPLDKGPMLVRRYLAERIRQEQQQAQQASVP